MKQFMLLLHERAGSFDTMSPADMGRVVAEYSAWAEKLRAENRLAAAQKLADGPGRSMEMKGGRLAITDGPFAESAEMIGGYFTILAGSYDEACRIAEACPHLNYGGRIEVRAVDA